MPLISIPNSFTAGTPIVASEHNDNFTTIANAVNGNLDNTNIKSAAGIVDSKLAQITTASKVSGAALTLLANIPAGAGNIPIANMGESTTYADTKAAKGANSDITSLSGLTTPLSTAQGGSAIAGKFYNMGTYTGTTANKALAHGLGSTPTYIMFIRATAASAPAFWLYGMGNNAQVGSVGAVQAFSSAPDATNINLLGTSAVCCVNGETYYWMAMV